MSEQRASAIIVSLVAAVMGISIGYAAMTVLWPKPAATPIPAATVASPSATTDTKSAALRANLTGLQREHVHLATQALRAAYDGRPDYAPAINQLDQNSKDLQAVVATYDGTAAAAKFYDSWNGQIRFLVDYTAAVKKGDKAAASKASADLATSADTLATILAQANSSLLKDSTSALLSDNTNLLKGVVDTYGAKDYAGSYDREHQASAQITKLADSLTAAIVKQNPAKF